MFLKARLICSFYPPPDQKPSCPNQHKSQNKKRSSTLHDRVDTQAAGGWLTATPQRTFQQVNNKGPPPKPETTTGNEYAEVYENQMAKRQEG